MTTSNKKTNNPSYTDTDGKGFEIYKRLASYAVKHWRYLIIAFIGLVLAGATVPSFAIYIQPLLDGTFMKRIHK